LCLHYETIAAVKPPGKSLPHTAPLIASPCTLSHASTHHAGLLQQVGLDAGASDAVALVEADLQQLAEAGGVIITQRLGVTKGLEDGVGLQNEGQHQA
jgi:hypothetical protein